jgi:hypothetical protein
MTLVIFIIVVLVVLALVLWAISYLPMIPANIKMLLNVLVILLAAVAVANKAGLF